MVLECSTRKSWFNRFRIRWRITVGWGSGNLFHVLSGIRYSWFVTFYRLRHNRKIGKNNNIIYRRRNIMKHKLIIRKCNIPRNSEAMIGDIITHKTLVRVTIPNKCILNRLCSKFMPFKWRQLNKTNTSKRQ